MIETELSLHSDSLYCGNVLAFTQCHKYAPAATHSHLLIGVDFAHGVEAALATSATI